jgi:hypothetical protein
MTTVARYQPDKESSALPRGVPSGSTVIDQVLKSEGVMAALGAEREADDV